MCDSGVPVQCVPGDHAATHTAGILSVGRRAHQYPGNLDRLGDLEISEKIYREAENFSLRLMWGNSC